MKKKKPDRFERLVRKQTGNDPFMLDSDIVALLRQQHRWMVRMVKAHARAMENPSLELDTRYIVGHKAAYRKILDQLTRRAK
jgi:hypothetical protein